MGYSENLREEIGRQTKRILDWGRIKFIEEYSELSASLKYYVSPDVSLENAVLLCNIK